MELDRHWLAKYLEGEIARLSKIEEGARNKELEHIGNIAKYDHLISLETVKDDEYKRSRRIAEKKLEHPRAILEGVSPKLAKLSESWAILNETL